MTQIQAYENYFLIYYLNQIPISNIKGDSIWEVY